MPRSQKTDPHSREQSECSHSWHSTRWSGLVPHEAHGLSVYGDDTSLRLSSLDGASWSSPQRGPCAFRCSRSHESEKCSNVRNIPFDSPCFPWVHGDNPCLHPSPC